MDTPSGRVASQGEPTLDTDTWLAAIAAAGAAPSIHNTQPWRFALRSNGVYLHADSSRQLAVADPGGRLARISCGAALLNLRIALQANGVEPVVSVLPRRSHDTLLAIVRPGGPHIPTPMELRLHSAIARRHSHRQPFHPAPVSNAALRAMVYAAATEGAYLRLVLDSPAAGTLLTLIRRAEHAQQLDPDYREELAKWTHAGGRADGVPHSASGPRPHADDPLAIRDFAPDYDRPRRHYESDPLFGVLLSPGDVPMDQLRCGQALQRALLTGTDLGIGASIISAPAELPGPRALLRRQIGGAMWPQLVLRFGSAQPTVATPRRPVSDVVDFSTIGETIGELGD